MQVSQDWANALREVEREGEALTVLDAAIEFNKRESAENAARRT